jgi:hypothetical protein
MQSLKSQRYNTTRIFLKGQYSLRIIKYHNNVQTSGNQEKSKT